MIFAFKKVGVELTPEELYDIVDNDKFDLFFDFLLDLEEESMFHTQNDMYSPDMKIIELTEKQEEKLMNQLVNRDIDGDVNFMDMTENEIMEYLLESGEEPVLDQNEEPDESTEEDKKLMRFIQRLK